MALALAMFEARRVREAIQLSEQLDESENADVRLAVTAFEVALLAALPLNADDQALAVHAAERRIERGERSPAAAAASTLAMRHRRARTFPRRSRRSKRRRAWTPDTSSAANSTATWRAPASAARTSRRPPITIARH